MTRVFHQSVMVFNADESEFVGNFYESVALGFEETEFLFGGERRRKRIFYDRSQSGISHYESAAPASVELVGEYAKSVGVAVKARDVVPLCAAELLTGFGVAVIAQFASAFAFREKACNGSFARMSERGIAHVVGKTGCRNNCSERHGKIFAEIFVACYDFVPAVQT